MTGAKRILVIDDERDFAQFVESVASGLGYDAVMTSTAAEFRAAYLAAPPDIVVLDIIMPDEDGIELIQWLIDNGCRARLVIVSGYRSTFAEAAKTIAEVKGGLKVVQLQKPVKLAELRAQLQAVAE